VELVAPTAVLDGIATDEAAARPSFSSSPCNFATASVRNLSFFTPNLPKMTAMFVVYIRHATSGDPAKSVEDWNFHMVTQKVFFFGILYLRRHNSTETLDHSEFDLITRLKH
jgi:hypothetical protein